MCEGKKSGRKPPPKILQFSGVVVAGAAEDDVGCFGRKPKTRIQRGAFRRSAAVGFAPQTARELWDEFLLWAVAMNAYSADVDGEWRRFCKDKNEGR